METNEQKIAEMKSAINEPIKKSLQQHIVDKINKDAPDQTERSYLEQFAIDNLEIYNYLDALVASEAVVTVQDFKEFDEAYFLDAYILLKTLHENKKLGRLAEMITGTPWEKVVVKKEFDGEVAAVGEIWKSNTTK